MYLNQFKKSNFNFLLYLPFPILFFGLMILNFSAIYLLHLDVNEVMQKEINKKGVNRFFIESLIPFAIGILLLFLWVKYVMKFTITKLTTSRKKIDFKRILFAFSVWAIFQIIIIFIDYNQSPEDYIINYDSEKFFTFFIIAIILIPFQTSFEEYLFRAHIMHGTGIITNSRLFALIFTSIAFGVMHIANPEVEKMGYIVLIYYIGTGFFLGIITLLDEGLELALGFHCANNLIGALLVTSNWSAFQTHSILKDVSEPTAGFEVLFPVLIVFPILLFIFSKRYQWTDWKEKLTGNIEIAEVNLTKNE